MKGESCDGLDAVDAHDLTPYVGARIDGVDLSRTVPAALFRAIEDVWLRKQVLLFRGQSLSEDDQVRFAEMFGPLNRSHTIKPHHSKTNNAVMFVSNIMENGQLIGAHPDGEMHFHTDQCHQPKPCSGTMLYAMEIPSKGGNTLFVSGYHAYETLPDDLRRRVEGLKAVNAYDYDHGETRSSFVKEGIPRATHPVVRTHPRTGRKALYVNRLMTAYIEGMDRAESEELLMALFAHQERLAYAYEHVWRPGDLVLWDNRCTLHARTDFDASERRLLRRVTMIGEAPE